MECNNADSAARAQHGKRLREPRLQLLQLTVDGDPQSLERPGCRMSPFALVLCGTAEATTWASRIALVIGAFLPLPNDAGRDSPGEPLLAVAKEDIGKLCLIEVVHHIGGGGREILAQPHVEGLVAVERETAAARFIVETRYAKVQENDVGRFRVF